MTLRLTDLDDLGTGDLRQTRETNKANEITDVGGLPNWMNPTYDARGNMATGPKPGSETTINVTYTTTRVPKGSRWENRLVKVEEGGSTVGEYRYDGLGRRIQEQKPGPKPKANCQSN